MPLHSWIDDDFAAFRAGLLSVTPSVPLQLNLRAIMAPALGKLRLYSKATVAFHFFTNPVYKEVHIMTVGAGIHTEAALVSERQRRSVGDSFLPSEDLPLYHRIVLDSQDRVESLFRNRDDEYKCRPEGSLLKVVKDHVKQFPEEFDGLIPNANDFVIVLPLRSPSYPRLGHFVLWSQGNSLLRTADSTPHREIRSTFQARMRQIIVRLFSNYYSMGPETYLPSYYLPGRKEVTLLGADIGGFHSVWEHVRDLPLSQDDKTAVRLNLVNKFGQIAAEAVGNNGGRIDQNWGSGVLAIFGEYPGDPEISPRISLKEALTAASFLVEEFSHYAQQWMEQNFKEYTFITFPPTPMVGIGIHRAPALFDYFGSADHRSFLSVGDHVSFVKALSSLASTSERFREKPILLHHSAEKHARSVVTRTMSEDLLIQGLAGPVRVFPISKEDVLLQPSQARQALTG